MAGLFKSLGHLFSGHAPAVYLAAFGKHPGWNDHIDDQGFESDRLIGVKRLLYVQGIGANIDAGAWDKLEPDQRLEGFRHALIWHSPQDAGGAVVGRLWASKDGKGRDKYPMAVAAQCKGTALEWAISTALPVLEKTQQRCEAASTAGSVIGALDADRAALQEAAKKAPVAALDQRPALLAKELLAVAEHPRLGPDSLGFYRILYQIERGMAAFRNGKVASARTEQLRVPRCSEDPLQCGSFWMRFLLSQLSLEASILALVPLEADFIDLIVGEPGPAHLFCARAGTKAVPLTSDIPYTLDADFLAAAGKFLAACREAPEGPLPAGGWR